MQYKNTTQIPNTLFDELLTSLSGAELKILLIILRKTNGWVDRKTGKRKERERISYKQFMRVAGLSKRTIIRAVQSLLEQKLITTTDFYENILTSEHRQGTWCIYYTSRIHLVTKEAGTGDKRATELVTKGLPIKTNPIKLKEEKLSKWKQLEEEKNNMRRQFEV